MEEKVVIKKMNKWVLKIMTDVIFLLLLFGLMIIVILHTILPFFPFLLLFDFCIIIGYPLFLRYILQRKWFECVKDYYLQTKYILLPYLMMEFLVLISYHKVTFFIIKTIMKNNS